MLNERQERFCRLYAQYGNASKAYVEAGYGARTSGSIRALSSALLARTNVKARIRELQAEAVQRSIMAADEMQQILTSISRGEAVKKPDPKTGETVEAPATTQERIKAMELLAKMGGLLLNRTEVTGDLVIDVRIDNGGDT